MASSGYIIEFDRESGFGLIQEDATKRILSVHRNSLKGRSSRYVKEDNQYVGELFDFDIITKPKNEGDIDTFEAINVRHRVLKCGIEGCSRIKAFTNAKALEDHIRIRHTLKKKKEETSQPSVVIPKKPKKKRLEPPKPITVTLSSQSTLASVGRFIGKQGANLKRLQEKYKIRLQIPNSQKGSGPLEILIKPNAGSTVDIQSLTKNLKFEWERCVREQERHEQMFLQSIEERIQSKRLSKSADRIVAQAESDSRYKDNSKFSYEKQLKQQDLHRRRIHRQTEPSVRVQVRHSSLDREGHRSAASCSVQDRPKSIFNYFQPKYTKKSMKEKNWLLNQQLQDLDYDDISLM